MIATILGMAALGSSIILACIGRKLLKGVGEKIADIIDELLWIVSNGYSFFFANNTTPIMTEVIIERRFICLGFYF